MGSPFPDPVGQARFCAEGGFVVLASQAIAKLLVFTASCMAFPRMNMFLTKSNVLARLTAKGNLVFKSFAIEDIGPYAVEDASWNYRDGILHIPFVHELVKNVPFAMSDEVLCNVFFQKLPFGLQIPMVVVDTEPKGKNYQLSFASWLFFCVVIQNSYEKLTATQTKVTTEYSVGFPKYLVWLFPLARLVLRRNYQILMSTDIPMRHRRGYLRSLGYRFASDINPSFVKSSVLNSENLLYPEQLATGPTRVDLVDLQLLIKGVIPEVAIGDDHAGGLLVRYAEGQLRLFPRMCPHEGAILDRAKCRENHLQCPWHGKQIAACATIDCKNPQPLTFQHPYYAGKKYALSLQGETLKVVASHTNPLNLESPQYQYSPTEA